jgi:lysophospholipase L1-like esterase
MEGRNVSQLRLLAQSSFLASLVAVTACSSATTASPEVVTTGDAAAAGSDSPSSDAPVATTSGFKTHVILGDSISDRGGEGPFFYDLLDSNNDAKYPDYKGKDLKTRFGADLKIEKHSKAGAKSADLVNQAKGLPTTLAGPVLITVTIGGNDVIGALGSLQTKGTDITERTAFTANLEAALTELTKADRFGAGVTVKIILPNIYDPSGGNGNFNFASGTSCPLPMGLWPASTPTEPLIIPWETAVTTVAAKFPQAITIDLKARFHDHGVPAAVTWFYSDCIHPNAPGHDQVRQLFWDAVSTL